MSVKEHRQPPIYTTGLIQVIVGVFLIIALLNRERSLALVTLTVLLVMTAIRFWSRASLRHLRVETAASRQRLFPGDRLDVEVTVENRKWLPLRLSMEVLIEAGLQEAIGQTPAQHEYGLLWYQKAQDRWSLQVRKRGVFQIGPARLTAGDLFGFYLHHQKTHRQPLEIIVYPRIRPLPHLDLPLKEIFGVPGTRSPVQDPIYIMGTRDYQQRQPARYIHWKASARHDRLQEKIFEPSSHARILLVVDVASFAAHEARDAFEGTLETAASIAVQCENRGFALGLLTNGTVHDGASFIPVSNGARNLTRLLEMLARMRMASRQSLKEVMHRVEWRYRGVSVVSLSYEDRAVREELLPHLRRRNIPVVSLVCRRPANDVGQRAPDGVSTMTLEALGVEVTPP